MPVDTDPEQRMPEESTPAKGGTETIATRRRLPWIAAAVVGVIVIVVAVILLSGGDDDKPSGTVRRAPATAITAARLAALPGEVGHAVFWAGPRAGATYELTRTSSDRIFVRYLPAGAEVGTDQATYLTVGSYPQRDALATLEATARAQGVATVPLPDGGRAFQDARRPTSAYAAYPGLDVQVEVFDPADGRALRAITDGELTRLGAAKGAPAGTVAPRIVTADELRAFAAAEDGPVYWAGERAGARYELTRTADGRVYVRYLAAGTEAGSTDAGFLTIGTYPQADALSTLKATAARRGSTDVAVGGGGAGAVLRGSPDSVYLAYPGVAAQIEVFDPKGGARALAQDGAVVAVR